MGTNLFQAFKIISKFRVDIVRKDLRIFAIYNILLSVEEPRRDLKLSRILDNVDDAFKFIWVEIASTGPTSNINIDSSANGSLTVY